MYSSKSISPNAVDQITDLLKEADEVRIHNIEKSIAIVEEAHQLSVAHQLDSLIAKSLSQMAFYFMIKGEHASAITFAKAASIVYEQLKDEKGLADVKYTIASVHYKSNNIHLGLQHLLECIVIYCKHNDYFSQAKSYKSLGTIYEYLGDEESALEVYELAITAAQNCGNVNMKTNVYNPLSGIYLNKNDIKKATELITASIRLKLKTGDIRGLAFAYYGKGKIYFKTKQYEQAEEYYLKSIVIHTEMGEKLGLGYSYKKLGLLYLEQNRFEEALDTAKKSLDLFEHFNSSMLKTGALLLLSKIYDKQNKVAEALQYLKLYIAEREENLHFQTNQIVSNYKMIQSNEAKALEDKLQIEKANYVAKAKHDFLASMSHEIRTPLNAVISIANLLQHQVTMKTEDAELLTSLQYASESLLGIVNNVLDFSKLEEGKFILEEKPKHIRHLIHNIYKTYESLAKQKGLAFTLVIEDSIEPVYQLDKQKIAQVLGNLLGNAIKFTSQGAVTLCIQKVAVTDGMHFLRFQVTDTGAGIPDDFLAKMFDKFSQPETGGFQKKGSSGLGLAIVKELITLYKSEINVYTQLGVGTTFSFDLVLQPVDALLDNTDAKVITPLTGLKILLAEDNKTNMLVATKILKRWNIIPDCVVDGNAALEASKLKKYDLILMDLQMPVLSGYEAAMLIKQNEHINSGTPIYAFTADITADANHAYTNCFEGFLHKPIEMDMLYDVLKLQQDNIKNSIPSSSMVVAN
jgi:signal transduction histidine kinase/CheY-like chemotaxis protein